jgi:hypothetical protein
VAEDRSTSLRAGPPYRYRADVLAALPRHGILPTPQTPPELVRDYVRDLYKWEIRRLRERYLRKEFAKQEYWQRVDTLRRQYPVLALLPRQFVEP